VSAVRLHAEDLEQLDRIERMLERVLEHLGDASPPAAGTLVDAAEIARRTGLTAATVRARADEFGAIRVGDGPRPRLRFDPDRVAAVLASGSTDRRSPESEAPAQPTIRRRRRRTRTGTGPELLPIKGTRAL
jgi:hypothetical protein